MKPSEAFLHPRRTAALADSLAAENATLRAQAEEAARKAAEDSEARERAEREADGLRASLREQERSQQELMRLLFSVRSDFEGRVRELEARLKESEDDTLELEEIDRQVRRMNESQEAYRRRIADLKMQLAEARAEAARLAGLKNSGLRPIIAMDAEDPPSDLAAGQADTDWLLPLPPVTP